MALFDQSWRQYLAHAFREFFSGTEDVTGGMSLAPADIPLANEIFRLLTDGGQTPEAVRHELLRRLQRQRIVAVTSGKGGVGKTTISVNLAVAFAALGQRVLLVDADLGMANVHVYCGVQPAGTLLDIVEGTRTLHDAVTVGPAGIHVLCGQSGTARAADLHPHWIEHLGAELRRANDDYDVVIFDTGAGISSQVMSFLSMADDIMVVATPNLASTLDAYGLIKVAREMHLRGEVRLLINHAEDAAQAEAVLQRIEGCARQFLHFEPSRLGVLQRHGAFEAAGHSRTPLLLAPGGEEHIQPFLDIARQFLAPCAEPSCSAAA